MKAPKVPFVYVGYKACGCPVAVVNDSPGEEKFTARSVAEFVRGGLKVTRMSFDDYRNNVDLRVRCPHQPPKDGGLFAAKGGRS